jgi:hypothetical protein
MSFFSSLWGRKGSEESTAPVRGPTDSRQLRLVSVPPRQPVDARVLDMLADATYDNTREVSERVVAQINGLHLEPGTLYYFRLGQRRGVASARNYPTAFSKCINNAVMQAIAAFPDTTMVTAMDFGLWIPHEWVRAVGFEGRVNMSCVQEISQLMRNLWPALRTLRLDARALPPHLLERCSRLDQLRVLRLAGCATGNLPWTAYRPRNLEVLDLRHAVSTLNVNDLSNTLSASSQTMRELRVACNRDAVVGDVSISIQHTLARALASLRALKCLDIRGRRFAASAFADFLQDMRDQGAYRDLEELYTDGVFDLFKGSTGRTTCAELESFYDLSLRGDELGPAEGVHTHEDVVVSTRVARGACALGLLLDHVVKDTTQLHVLAAPAWAMRPSLAFTQHNAYKTARKLWLFPPRCTSTDSERALHALATERRMADIAVSPLDEMQFTVARPGASARTAMVAPPGWRDRTSVRIYASPVAFGFAFLRTSPGGSSLKYVELCGFRRPRRPQPPPGAAVIQAAGNPVGVGVALAASCPHLEVCNLLGSDVTDADFHALRMGCLFLRELRTGAPDHFEGPSVAPMGLTKEGFWSISKMTGLRVLQYEWTNAMAQGDLAELACRRWLTHLNVWPNGSVSGTADLIPQCPSLVHVVLHQLAGGSATPIVQALRAILTSRVPVRRIEIRSGHMRYETDSDEAVVLRQLDTQGRLHTYAGPVFAAQASHQVCHYAVSSDSGDPSARAYDSDEDSY